jgi:hypothetical protein
MEKYNKKYTSNAAQTTTRNGPQKPSGLSRKTTQLPTPSKSPKPKKPPNESQA